MLSICVNTETGSAPFFDWCLSSVSKLWIPFSHPPATLAASMAVSTRLLRSSTICDVAHGANAGGCGGGGAVFVLGITRCVADVRGFR